MLGPIGLATGLFGCAAGGTPQSTTFGSVTIGSGTTAGTSGSEASSETAGTSGGGSSGADVTSTTAETGGTAGSSDSGDALPCGEVLESFTVDPGWTSTGLPSDGNVFGWVDSGNAAGMPGEIGGTMQRAGIEIAYADRTISVAAGDCIAASGWIALPSEDSNYNSLLHFGHFGTNAPHIGFTFAEGDNSTLRVSMEAGTFSEQELVLDDIATPRMWSYVYDPVEASMTLAFDGFGSVTRPVPSDMIGDVTAIDSFGVFKHPHDTPADYPGLLELYLDEIAYTR
jgi:hypothetical protein